MKTGAIAALTAAILVSACATAPGRVKPASIGDEAYLGASCARLAEEKTRLDADYAHAAHAQNVTRDFDFAGLLLVGLPVARLTGHNHAKEISLIKGDQLAVARAAHGHNCAS